MMNCQTFNQLLKTTQMSEASRHFETIVDSLDKSVTYSMSAFNAKIREYCEQHGLDELMADAIFEIKLDKMLMDCDNKMPTHGESW